MNDETTKEIEDLSTLACSTDEALRRRALMALLGRVVGRADRRADTDPLRALHEEMDRADVPKRGAPLEDRVTALWQDRDEWMARAESRIQALGQAASERNQYLSERNHLRADVGRLERERDAAKEEACDYSALLGRVWDAIPGYVAMPNKAQGLVEAVTALAISRDTHKANAETLARDLAEARAEVARLRSLAGSPEAKEKRVLTRQEESALMVALSSAPSYGAWLRWMEREGYLSVRLPTE